MKKYALLFLLAACGPEHRGNPRGPELRTKDPAVARGERLFQKFCYQCHPAGAAGIGPALNDKPLPQIAVRTQIRQGVGSMPSFGDEWLTDKQVDDIAEYVQALRDTPATF